MFYFSWIFTLDIARITVANQWLMETEKETNKMAELSHYGYKWIITKKEKNNTNSSLSECRIM